MIPRTTHEPTIDLRLRLRLRAAAVDQQRERCVRGRELIAHFLDFNSGDPARLAPVFGTVPRPGEGGGRRE